MEPLGPIYPFGPLPPPENPAARGKVSRAESEPERRVITPPQSGMAGNTKDFATLLNNKKTEMLTERDISSYEVRELEQAARDFEAFFIASLLKKFYDANMKSELFPKAAGSDLFMDMFLEGVADEIAGSHNNLGVSDMIIKSIQERLEHEVL